MHTRNILSLFTIACLLTACSEAKITTKNGHTSPASGSTTTVTKASHVAPIATSMPKLTGLPSQTLRVAVRCETAEPGPVKRVNKRLEKVNGSQQMVATDDTVLRAFAEVEGEITIAADHETATSVLKVRVVETEKGWLRKLGLWFTYLHFGALAKNPTLTTMGDKLEATIEAKGKVYTDEIGDLDATTTQVSLVNKSTQLAPALSIIDLPMSLNIKQKKLYGSLVWKGEIIGLECVSEAPVKL